MMCMKRTMQTGDSDPGSHPEKLRLAVVTWNVGNAEPAKDLAPLIGPTDEIDMVVLGLQEARYPETHGLPVPAWMSKNAARDFAKESDFMQRVIIHLGECVFG